MTSVGWLVDCPALDYDDIRTQIVKKDVNNLQEKHRLGDAEIYLSSKNSYHVYFFNDNQLQREEELQIIKDAEFVDEDFKEFQKDREQTRMRVKGKHKQEIKHVDTIESKYGGHGSKQKAEHLKRMLNRMS